MITIILALVLSVAPCSAEETAQFLKIGVGARSAAMGGAYTAMAKDVSALFWNPAGLAGLNQREVGAMHAELAQDTRYDFLGAAAPLRKGTLGLGASYLSQGAITGRDDNGRITGGYNAADAAVNLAYAAPLTRGFQVGATVKYIQSNIAQAQAQSAALDLGALYALGAVGPGITRIGFAVQNLGPGLRYLDRMGNLPLTLAMGVAYQLPIGFALALDYRHRPYSGASEVSLGTEYALLAGLAIRAGYASSPGGISGLSRANDLMGFNAGFGVKLRGFNVDYSMTPLGSFGNAQRLSVDARFGGQVLPEHGAERFQWKDRETKTQ